MSRRRVYEGVLPNLSRRLSIPPTTTTCTLLWFLTLFENKDFSALLWFFPILKMKRKRPPDYNYTWKQDFEVGNEPKKRIFQISKDRYWWFRKKVPHEDFLLLSKHTKEKFPPPNPITAFSTKLLQTYRNRATLHVRLEAHLFPTLVWTSFLPPHPTYRHTVWDVAAKRGLSHGHATLKSRHLKTGSESRMCPRLRASHLPQKAYCVTSSNVGGGQTCGLQWQKKYCTTCSMKKQAWIFLLPLSQCCFLSLSLETNMWDVNKRSIVLESVD